MNRKRRVAHPGWRHDHFWYILHFHALSMQNQISRVMDICMDSMSTLGKRGYVSRLKSNYDDIFKVHRVRIAQSVCLIHSIIVSASGGGAKRKSRTTVGKGDSS